MKRIMGDLIEVMGGVLVTRRMIYMDLRTNPSHLGDPSLFRNFSFWKFTLFRIFFISVF